MVKERNKERVEIKKGEESMKKIDWRDIGGRPSWKTVDSLLKKKDKEINKLIKKIEKLESRNEQKGFQIKGARLK